MSRKPGWNCARHRVVICACLLAALLLSGCRSATDDLGKYPAPPPTQVLATLLARGIATARSEYPAPIPGPLRGPNPTLPPPTTLPTESLPKAVLASQYYLAGHLGITQQGIELISWENAVWLTGRLGCLPNESLATLSPTPGYRVIIKIRGKVYEMRSDAAGEQICVVKALQPGERVPLLQVKSSQTAADLARNHLAARLGISTDEIVIQEVQPGEWEDETLGCPQAAGNQPARALPRSIQGERILLSAREVTHEYHSGGLWLVYCGVMQLQ